MKPTPMWRRYLRFWMTDVNADVNDEFEFHIQMRTEELIHEGCEAGAARDEARRLFGNRTQHSKVCLRIGERQVSRRNRTAWLDNLRQDLRQSVRLFAKNPTFTLVAVLTLAVSIGANTTIFSVINTVLIQPLPYSEPERLVAVGTNFGPPGFREWVTPTKFVFWREHNQVFDQLGAFEGLASAINITGSGEPELLHSVRISFELFPLLGIHPSLGRFFTQEEGRPGGGDIVLLSHGLWKRRFGTDPGIVGRSVELNGRKHTVVGIMPPGLGFRPAADVWIPLRSVATPGDRAHILKLIGRLKPGLTIAQARAGLDPLADLFREHYPELYEDGEEVDFLGYQESQVGDIRPALLVLAGAVGFVLLIACANIANLLLSRATSRNQEITLRAALGATRSRIVRQLLTESLLLSCVGAAGGLGLSRLGLKLLLSLGSARLLDLREIQIDPRVLLFTLAISIATAVLFGLVPAILLSQQELRYASLESGKRTTTGRSRRKMGGALVVAEVTLALVLLIGATLLIQTFVRLQGVDTGFRSDNILTLQIALTGTRYDRTRDLAEFLERAFDRIDAIPGVVAAAAVTRIPTEGGMTLSFEIESRPSGDGDLHVGAYWRAITPDYFKVMGIPLLRGRVFESLDRGASTKVAIISQAAARRFWPNVNPLGEHITIGRAVGPAFADSVRQIVGIVGNTREKMSQEPPPVVYVPIAQVPDSTNAEVNRLLPANWVIRTNREPLRMAAAVRESVASVDSNQAVANFRSMEQILARSILPQQFNMLLVALFALVALFLAAIGIYGTLSYSVNQRTHEIGVRAALGATPKDVLVLVLSEGLFLAILGLVLGIGAAYGLTRFISSMLFGVGVADPMTFMSAALFLGFVALLACYVPARRAAKVDPITALRYE